MHFHRIAGICVFASLIAACSGQNTTSLLPSRAAEQQPTGSISGRPVFRSDTASATTAQTSLSSVKGTISGTTTGKFIIATGTASGNVPVTTAGASINTDGASLATGHYAIAVGSGSSALAATYVAVFSSEPSSVTLSGTVSGTTSYGFILKTTASGNVPVMLTSATTGSYTVGSAATVTGSGSGSVAVLASSISSSAVATAAASPSVATHVITGDYLGSPWGSTTVAPSTAAKYLNIVRTAPANGNAMHAAGLQVQIYMNPLHVESTDPLHALVASSAFSQTCSDGRIYSVFAGNDEWLMNPNSSNLQTEYAAMVASDIAGQHVDNVFEDNAGPIEYDGITWDPSEPCDYTDSTWIAGEKAMEAKLPVPTIANGLSAFGSETAVAPAIQLLSNSNTVGGNLEQCFGTTASVPEQGSWPWVLTEQTQLQVTAESKHFQCEADTTTEADDSYPARIFTLASFLMTYNQTYSSLWELYGTPSGVHVMPESQLVPTEPLVATPSSIATLERGTDTYVREYKACYYAGKLVGACAMVVNMDYASHPKPSLTQTYTHTLALSGNGVLDGGTASFTGAAPPATMAERSAFIALP